MSPLATNATTALLRALRKQFGIVNFVKFERVDSREWASITFNGARHEIAIRLVGPSAQAAADRFLAGLDTSEYRLRGHLLADIALIARERTDDGVRLEIEALTVEDG